MFHQQSFLDNVPNGTNKPNDKNFLVIIESGIGVIVTILEALVINCVYKNYHYPINQLIVFVDDKIFGVNPIIMVNENN